MSINIKDIVLTTNLYMGLKLNILKN